MALVIIAAVFLSLLFLLFKVFDRRRIPLLPAIIVNYVVATVCGSVIAPPWRADDLSPLLLPSALLGVLFIVLFYLMAVSTQRVGVAATSVASKMSLVLTVLVLVIVEGELPGALVSMGIALAIAGVICTTWSEGVARVRGAWVLPLVLFAGNAAVDLLLAWTQQNVVTPATEAVFPTLTFAVAGTIGAVRVLASKQRTSFTDPGVLIGGTVLGVANFTSVYFVVRSLAQSGLPASSVFPLINIGVILLGAGFSAALFRERLSKLNLLGIAAAVIALVCILAGQA
ncbi:MAG: EamA family transporter [Flavobacteriales bacterium]|nr:EamA family transporter [Flavobacteriales bacterium]MBK6752271.1 EamA family transporter [Flavobacteriales bacterium]MBK7752275.1 EamA family transporter [Flavobacteriales bacterium]